VSIVVSHEKRDDFVWVGFEPPTYGGEVRLKCADIEEIARGMTETDFGRAVRLLGLE
jgi:hypothetical protein